MVFPYLYLAAGLAIFGAGVGTGWKFQSGRVDRAQKGRANAEAGQALAEAAVRQAQAIGEAQRKAAADSKTEADALRARGPQIVYKTRRAPIGPTPPDALAFLRDEVRAEQAVDGGGP